MEIVSRWREGEKFHFRLKLRNTETGTEMTTPYSGGCLAFMPDKQTAGTIAGREDWNGQIDTVRNALSRMFGPSQYRDKPKMTREQALAWMEIHAAPDLPGVLNSLLLDSDAGQQSFRDFCSDFSYDEDSRSAYNTWEQCADMAGEFRRFAGEHLGTLRDALQDY